MDWGKWIIVSFVLFALFIGVLVAVCVRQDISLVADDYYKQELEYQKQIDRNANVLALASKPSISITASVITVSFPDFSKVKDGELKLFRPSNAASDVVFKLRPTSDTVQSFDLNTRERGMYKVQMKWSMEDKEYYLEETVYL